MKHGPGTAYHGPSGGYNRHGGRRYAGEQNIWGGRHCGAVRYEATTDLKQVVSCNCSICMKRGLLLIFVGTEQFARKTIHHLFCSACGVESFARGTAPDDAEMIAVNVRCLDDVDIATLTPTPFDGRNL